VPYALPTGRVRHFGIAATFSQRLPNVRVVGARVAVIEYFHNFRGILVFRSKTTAALVALIVLACGDTGLGVPTSDLNGSADGSHLLVSYPGGAAGVFSTSNPTVPVGLAFCLAHGDPFGRMQSGDQVPFAVPSDALIGCDRVFAPGSSGVVDFDVSNTPGFARFAELITNGIDERVAHSVAMVNGSLRVVHPLGGGSIVEQDFTDRRVNGGTATGGLTGPDLAGFNVNRIRLEVSNVEFTREPNGTFSWRYALEWTLWGRVTP